jgi:hypothetical protein
MEATHTIQCREVRIINISFEKGLEVGYKDGWSYWAIKISG